MRCFTLSLVTVFVAGSSAAQAQGAEVGKVSDLKRLGEPPTCQPVVSAPLGALRRRLADANQELMGPKTPVRITDRLALQQSADAQLQIDSKPLGMGGTFTLTPTFGRCVESVVDTAGSARVAEGRNLGARQDALYQIGSRPDRVPGAQRLLLLVEAGGVAISWQRGALTVIALGRELPVTGTELAVFLDSSATRAYLYVKSGKVLLDSVSGLAAGQRDFFTWTHDSAPERISPAPERLDKEFQFHAHDIWQAAPTTSIGSFIKRHPVWSGSFALGAGYVVVRLLGGHDDGQRSGTVTVPLPI